MTKQEFLEGKPFKVLGQVLKFDSLGEVDRPLKGCITKLSSYRIEAYEYAANIDRITSAGVSVSAVWCGKIVTGFLRFSSLEVRVEGQPEVQGFLRRPLTGNSAC